jgi:hypothetical protein
MKNELQSPALLFLKYERGGALVAALILVVISGIMGATILFATSTDIQISGNYRRTLQSFYAAEAGLAESRRRLIGSPTTNSWFAGDPAPAPQSNWSAYVLTRAGWKPQEDPSYSTLLANYVPVKENTTNTIIVPNSVQSTLSYWSKIRHKTEFDAEQSGHSVVSRHYLDGDGSTKPHSQANRGNLILYGYPEDFSDHPRQFSANMPTMYPPVEVVLSQGEVEGAMSVIQAEVAHHPGPPILGAVHIGRQAVLDGKEIAISGMDSCGLLPNGRSPISLGPEATVFGTATLSGNPSSPAAGWFPQNVRQQIADLASEAQRIPGEGSGLVFGAVDAPTVQYAEPASGVLSLYGVSGFGVLLVDGSLRIVPPFQWEGLVLVSNEIIIEEGVSPVHIRGALYADSIQIFGDHVTIVLDTCPIAASLPLFPLKVLNWRQLL